MSCNHMVGEKWWLGKGRKGKREGKGRGGLKRGWGNKNKARSLGWDGIWNLQCEIFWWVRGNVEIRVY
jgi:hypothetical protein